MAQFALKTTQTEESDICLALALVDISQEQAKWWMARPKFIANLKKMDKDLVKAEYWNNDVIWLTEDDAIKIMGQEKYEEIAKRLSTEDAVLLDEPVEVKGELEFDPDCAMMTAKIDEIYWHCLERHTDGVYVSTGAISLEMLKLIAGGQS